MYQIPEVTQYEGMYQLRGVTQNQVMCLQWEENQLELMYQLF